MQILDTAPGAPGIAPRWTSSAKSGVGTARNPASKVWFTLSHGILNEVYYPRVDSACTRDFGFLVASDEGFWEEKHDCVSQTRQVEPGVPAYEVESRAEDGAFTLHKRIVTDPERPVLLQQVRFEGAPGQRLYALLAPHLVNAGAANSGWIARMQGAEFLCARGAGRFLALACDTGFRAMSAGFVGASDGWQQLSRDHRLDPCYARADNGNIALTGALALEPGAVATLALGFGQTEAEAAARALAALKAGFDTAWDSYVQGWRDWQAGLTPLAETKGANARQIRISAAVLASHRAADRPGATVASLSIPWGFSKGDGDLGGYHLVWPRDLVETASGFLAIGDSQQARAILDYLTEVQLPSGKWPQNMWLDGEPYWSGEQLDEVAFPILLAEILHRAGALPDLAPYLAMLRGAAGFLLKHGPVTGEDRWEENAGFSPFTLAVEIAALLAGADLFEAAGEGEAAAHLRETADCWNAQIEDWTWASDPNLCAEAGVEGYYVRIAPPGATDAVDPGESTTQVKNRPPDRGALPTRDVVSPDALALVRFGLRAADDPRILATVKVIDHSLKVALPQGPLWRRYNGDGYGEHEDGAPFDGVGIGRAWPLLAGERAHYELAAGHVDEGRRLLAALEGSANAGGMIPEQSWDSDDIPARELVRGGPAGSAMPLVWAHAEHLKLVRSLRDGAIFDQPPQARARYVDGKQGSDLRIWRADNRITRLPEGHRLRIELTAPAMVRWSTNGWKSTEDVHTRETAFGTHVVTLALSRQSPGTAVSFTFQWDRSGCEGQDYTVGIAGQSKDG